MAAGYYDGFFETGLSPWDIAAGSLMITEAGGLIGNFTGDADFLYQREVVAGNPKIYGQLVQTLAPYTKVIKAEAASATPGSPPVATEEAGPTPEAALAAALGASPALAEPVAPPVPKKPAAVRIRKADVKPGI